MPCEILHDTFELEAMTLEALMPDPVKTETIQKAYPFPLLRKSGRTAQLSFRTVVLSNALVQVTIALDLGGRILAWHDRRTGTDIIPLPTQLNLREGGLRGIWLDHGIEIALGSEPRGNAMGPVEFFDREPESDEDAAELTVHELVPGGGINWLLRFRLEPDSANLHLECRVHSRVREQVSAASGLRWGLANAQELRSGVIASTGDKGVAIVSPEGTWDEVSGSALLRRSRHEPLLQPHEVDRWTADLVPFSGVANPISASPVGVLGLDESQLTLQTSHPVAAAKLVLQIETGQSFEAPVSPEVMAGDSHDISGLPSRPMGVVLRDATGEDLIRFTGVESLPAELNSVQLASRRAGTRHLAHWDLACAVLKTKDFEAANAHLEDALLYNGDDPLAWWLKAVVQRFALGPQDDRPELLNAHYLNPLEPALRCESVLQQPGQTSEPNPLLKPLAHHPEALIDIACLLIEAGLIEEASRLIDEALRHREQPMLRTLHAWMLFKHSRMQVEVGEQLQRVAQAPWEPPFPWRAVEREAIEQLAAAFPANERLQKWHVLLASI